MRGGRPAVVRRRRDLALGDAAFAAQIDLYGFASLPGDVADRITRLLGRTGTRREHVTATRR